MRVRQLASALRAIPTDHVTEWRDLKADYVRLDNASRVGLAGFNDQALADADRAFLGKTEFVKREIARLAMVGLPGLTIADVKEIYS